jgi:uncharacterized protein (DUF4415 family)
MFPQGSGAVRPAISREKVIMSRPPGRIRPGDPRQAAEAAFKAVTAKSPEAPPKRPSMPNAKEMISLRIDRDVLDFFQDDGPGWQDRINDVLRRAAGK